MKHIAIPGTGAQLITIFTTLMLWAGAAQAQPKTLATVINEAIEFKKASGMLVHVIDCDFSLKEGAVIIKNISPASLSVEQKKHKLGTKENIREYLTMRPDPYLRSTNLNSQIADMPKFTATSNDYTYTISSNSTLVSNPDLVDLLTISYTSGKSTTHVGLRNNASVTEADRASFPKLPSGEYINKIYIISATVDGKTVRVELRFRSIAFG